MELTERERRENLKKKKTGKREMCSKEFKHTQKKKKSKKHSMHHAAEHK